MTVHAHSSKAMGHPSAWPVFFPLGEPRGGHKGRSGLLCERRDGGGTGWRIPRTMAALCNGLPCRNDSNNCGTALAEREGRM